MIRTERMHRFLERDDIDVLVTTTQGNTFYASGFRGPLKPNRYSVWTTEVDEPILVLPNGDADLLLRYDIDYERLYTYGDYYLYSGEHLSERERAILDLNFENNSPTDADALVEALDAVSDADATLAVEHAGVTPGLADRLRDDVAHDEFRWADDSLAGMRSVKNSDEVERLRRSVAITEASITESVKQVEPGMTERDLERIFKTELVERGGEPGFCQIGFGPHSAESCVPGDEILRKGDLILYDCGCEYEGYVSDIARTFSFGEPDDRLREIYDVLRAGLDRGIDLLEDGADTAEVFEGTMAYIRSAGDERDIDALSEFERHHVGHGIGIDTYDTPVIDEASATIRDGMVMCLEPPYYEIGTGGIQVEDEVLVTEDGAKRLSQCQRTLTPVAELRD